MTRTKLDTPAFADQSVDSRNISDGTIQAQDVAPGTVSADKLSDTLDLSSKTVTLPNTSVANAKLANSSITVNGSSVALGASTSVTVFLDWQAVTVADGSTQLTAEAGKGYFLDTNAGVIEVKLPASPNRGDTIALVDYAGHFDLNRIEINTQGVSIDSSETDGSSVGGQFRVDKKDAIVELVYVDGSKGWMVTLNQVAGSTPGTVMTNSGTYTPLTHITATGGTVTTTGNFKIHTFTGDGTFCVSYAGCGNQSGPSIVDYLVVAGGGGGTEPYGGGGGGGGVRESLASASPTHTANTHTASPIKSTTGITVSASPGEYPITVGAGGSAGGPSGAGGDGSNSVFSTITSAAGGGGGGGPPGTGAAGGSGGGGGAYFPGPYGTGPGSRTTAGNGNTPPVSPSQGNNGGYGLKAPNGVSAGGGGGATEAYFGGHGYASPCGSGGVGKYGPGPGGSPGAGAGATNRGGGGGGGWNPTPAGGQPRASQAGGKGIVVIRYKFK